VNDSAHSTPMEDIPKIPKGWFGSGEEKAFAERLAATSKDTLLLDYDGTLAPFHADKMQAFPYVGVAEVLQRLNQYPNTRLVLVTGRRAADLLDLIEVCVRRPKFRSNQEAVTPGVQGCKSIFIGKIVS
jgi:hypothetical protein